jgi:hypothetical protein
MTTFYTSIICKDARFNSIELCKDTALLEPNTRRKVAAIIADAKAAGHVLAVIETYRSEARQEQLFQNGATQLKQVGCHHYGVACDLGFLKPDGSVNWDANYSVLAELAKNHNLVSGFNWKFKDSDHVQNCAVSDQPVLFAGTFYPDEVYNALAHP